MVAATADEAIDNAHRYTGCQSGQCLKYTRTWLEIGSYYGDAATAWRNAKRRHDWSNSPPAGAPVFWTGGSHGYGHIALSLGGGRIRTTDAPHGGNVTDQDIGWVKQHWGLTPAGWTEDLNTVSIPYLSDGLDPQTDDADDQGDDDMPKEYAYLKPDKDTYTLTADYQPIMSVLKGKGYMTGEVYIQADAADEIHIYWREFTPGGKDAKTDIPASQIPNIRGGVFAAQPFTVRNETGGDVRFYLKAPYATKPVKVSSVRVSGLIWR